MSGRNVQKRRKKRSPLRTFLKIVFTIVLVFLVVAAGGLAAYLKFGPAENETNTNTSSNTSNNQNGGLLGLFTDKGIALNVAVFGVDLDETRTDVIFIVHFDSKQEQINVLSVPRDTRVEVADSVRQKLDEAGRYYPDVCKINEVHSYAGKELGPECAVLQLEDLLDIDIDHYVKVNVEGFKNIVDAIGGVDIDVPQDMYHVDDDPEFTINLKQGMQHLDGTQALQLVRYRSYKLGDETRVQVQQLFLKEFANKIMNTGTILSNLPELIQNVYTYVTTDISLVDALGYLKYIDDVDMDKTQMDVLPGSGQYIGNVSYYVSDEAATEVVVDRLFRGIDPAAEVEASGTSSKGLSIEVANGGVVEGLAAKNQEKLEAAGYTIATISTYPGEKTEQTRIYVRQEGYGQDLQAYYPGSEIIVDETMLDDGIDIKIILGTSET